MSDSIDKADSRKKLETALIRAKAALDYWNSNEGINELLTASSLPPITRNLGIAFVVKVLRQFQTVIELIERQEAEDAAVIARSMLEAWISMAFIMRPAVTIPADSKLPTTHALNHEFRSKLYAAHCLLKEWNRWDELIKLPPFADEGRRRLAELTSSPDWAMYIGAIGPEWESKLKKANHCSGLSIRKIALEGFDDNLRFCYASNYPELSSAAHAGNGIAYFSAGPDKVGRGVVQSSAAESLRIFVISWRIFLCLIDEFVHFLPCSASDFEAMKDHIADLMRSAHDLDSGNP
jgi:Family of unknown function (DUF5677)